ADRGRTENSNGKATAHRPKTVSSVLKENSARLAYSSRKLNSKKHLPSNCVSTRSTLLLNGCARRCKRHTRILLLLAGSR
uniref:Uncharacterized protein n=1 Tax=Aegilops tauschii subsp. strangulata TaxID=200361 RepID=A0A453IJJ6_AEGTS